MKAAIRLVKLFPIDRALSMRMITEEEEVKQLSIDEVVQLGLWVIS